MRGPIREMSKARAEIGWKKVEERGFQVDVLAPWWLYT